MILDQAITIINKYHKRLGKYPNLLFPKTLNEKMQWIKLFYRDYRMVIGCDKQLAKKYISDHGYGEFLPKTIALYDSVDEIEINKLPERFVMKTTHGSGYVIICTDRERFNLVEAKRKLNKWLHIKYGKISGEWFYDVLKPKIIVEEYIENYDGSELLDYKLICMNGKLVLPFVTMNRSEKRNMTVDFYTKDWKRLYFSRSHKTSKKILPKPPKYDNMIKIAESLSKEFPLCRVDFYITDHQLYIGELTFLPGSGLEGFNPDKYDLIYGKQLRLPGFNICVKKLLEYYKKRKQWKIKNELWN